MLDVGLISKVRQGAPGAFDELYFATIDRVHRQLVSLVGADPELDDLIQTTFIQVFRALASYRGDAQFTTWLHRIVVNVALGHLRRKQSWLRWRGIPSDDDVDGLASHEPTPQERAFRGEQVRQVHAMLSELKAEKRIAFVLYEVEGHTLEEIAALTDTSVNTVAARLRAARLEVAKAVHRHQLRERHEHARPSGVAS